MKLRLAEGFLLLMLAHSLSAEVTLTSYLQPISAAEPNISSTPPKTYNITAAGVTSRLYRNPSSDRLLIILHGGASYGDFIFTITRDAIGWYELAEYLAARGMNVAVPYAFNYSAKRELWPIQLASSFSSLNITRFYLLGHSAGGTIAANVLVGSNLFQKAVIMNGLLWWNQANSKLFAVAAEAGKARVDHMLIYGSNDKVAPVKPNAETWMSKADPLKAKLKVFSYGHDLDASIKNTVYREVASFLVGEDDQPPASSPPLSTAALSLTLRATDQNGKDKVTFRKLETVNLWITVKGEAKTSHVLSIRLRLTDSASIRFIDITYPVELQGSVDLTVGFAFNIALDSAEGVAVANGTLVDEPANAAIAIGTLSLTIAS